MAEHGVLELQGTDRGTAAEPSQRSVHDEIEEEQHPRILEDAAQGANLGYSCPTGRKSEFTRALLVNPFSNRGEQARRRATPAGQNPPATSSPYRNPFALVRDETVSLYPTGSCRCRRWRVGRLRPVLLVLAHLEAGDVVLGDDLVRVAIQRWRSVPRVHAARDPAVLVERGPTG